MIFWLTTFFSLILVALVRKLALWWQWVDIPNQRSNHEQPTPTGGGIAMVVVLVFSVWGNWSSSLAFCYLAGILFLALVGFVDDLRGVAAKIRFIIHLLISGLAAVCLGFIVPTDFTYLFFSFILMVGLINIYNFMDGIDGLAGLEGLLGGIFCAWILADYPLAVNLVPLPVFYAIAGCSAGFLWWNFPWRRRAKIFMGDTGSTVLGFSLAFLACCAAAGDGKILLALLLPLTNFIVDGLLTLFKRVMAGEKWYHPHRQHLYQLLVAAGCSHRRVVIGEAVMVLLGYFAAMALLNLPSFWGWMVVGIYLLLLPLIWLRLRCWALRKLMVLVPE